MTTLDNENLAKTSTNFYCKFCNYNTSRKYNYDLHIETLKHKNNQKTTQNNGFLVKTSTKPYMCENCDKIFNDRAGLWRHKQKCINNEQLTCINSEHNLHDKDNLIIELLKQNKELLEIVKNGTQNTNCNNTTTNSHNKAFNLNFFLNETCKEAMNIGEFVDSLKLQVSDLEKVGEAGYIEGITSIIVKNLKALDVTKRPVHCTDKKRETVYIKDNDIWEKDEDRSKMHKLIKKVAYKNANLFSKYREEHPDCKEYHSKYNDQYQKIVYESMGGKGDDDFEKNEKIIKNVLKEVVVDKNI